MDEVDEFMSRENICTNGKFVLSELKVNYSSLSNNCDASLEGWADYREEHKVK